MPVELSRPRDSEAVLGSLRALLAGVVDYAGLFPPAKLDMPQTVSNYADDLGGPDSWMLGRLIVPAGRLNEFERQAEGRLPTESGAEPWHLSALVAPADDPQLDTDLQRVCAFNEAHAAAGRGLATIRTIELRAGTADAIESALNLIPDELFPFFELSAAQDPRGLMAALAGSDAGAKVRTGGLEPQAVPKPEHLARFIAACSAAGLPFKATAGLHHPLRHDSPAHRSKEFGFLNVFVAAVLADKAGLGEQDLPAILADESPDAFAFHDDELRYRDHALATDQVAEARLKFAISFGSCSFAEPRERLRTMKLL
ncbi:MAG: hypothetical protein ACYSW1_12570 [Planctomycetota bacterium]|jgi:hypothetical protein